MKYPLLLVICLFFITSSYSQDIIYKTNGEKLTVRITGINPHNILFKNPDSVSIKEKTIPLKEVYMIRFSDGVEEIFAPQKPVRKEKYFFNQKNYYLYSVASGFGPSYGWLGFRFQGRVGEKQGLGYHAGIGVFPGNSWDQPARICYSAGAKYFFYKGCYLNMQVGRMMLTGDRINPEHDSLHSSFFWAPAFGMSILTGGDFFFNKYLGINAAMGVTINLSNPALYAADFAMDVGFVYKFGTKKR